MFDNVIFLQVGCAGQEVCISSDFEGNIIMIMYSRVENLAVIIRDILVII